MKEAWLIEGAGMARLSDVIVHDDGGWHGYPWYKRLQCPLCRDTYQHTGHQQTILGNDNYEAGWEGRGDLLVVPLEGECGHLWEICLGFHKGETFVFVRVGASNYLDGAA